MKLRLHYSLYSYFLHLLVLTFVFTTVHFYYKYQQCQKREDKFIKGFGSKIEAMTKELDMPMEVNSLDDVEKAFFGMAEGL